MRYVGLELDPVETYDEHMRRCSHLAVSLAQRLRAMLISGLLANMSVVGQSHCRTRLLHELAFSAST